MVPAGRTCRLAGPVAWPDLSPGRTCRLAGPVAWPDLSPGRTCRLAGPAASLDNDDRPGSGFGGQLAAGFSFRRRELPLLAELTAESVKQSGYLTARFGLQLGASGESEPAGEARGAKCSDSEHFGPIREQAGENVPILNILGRLDPTANICSALLSAVQPSGPNREHLFGFTVGRSAVRTQPRNFVRLYCRPFSRPDPTANICSALLSAVQPSGPNRETLFGFAVAANRLLRAQGAGSQSQGFTCAGPAR